VEIENVNRNLDMGKPILQAILDGAQQIAVPALVSTLCICIVFYRCSSWAGSPATSSSRSREAVIFADARVLPPVADAGAHDREGTCSLRRSRARRRREIRWPRAAGVRTRVRAGSRRLPATAHRSGGPPPRLHPGVPGHLCIHVPARAATGRDFFPDTDSGQFTLHLRTQTGTRIEETARLTDLVEAAIRREIPAGEIDVILDKHRLPYSAINWMHSSSGVHRRLRRGLLVSLKRDHGPTADYVRTLRQKLPAGVPGRRLLFPGPRTS